MKVALHIWARMLFCFMILRWNAFYKVKSQNIKKKSIYCVHGVPKSRNFARHLLFFSFLEICVWVIILNIEHKFDVSVCLLISYNVQGAPKSNKFVDSHVYCFYPISDQKCSRFFLWTLCLCIIFVTSYDTKMDTLHTRFKKNKFIF